MRRANRDGLIYLMYALRTGPPPGGNGPWLYPRDLDRPFPGSLTGRARLMFNESSLAEGVCECPVEEVGRYFPFRGFIEIGVGHLGCMKEVPLDRAPLFWVREVYKTLNRMRRERPRRVLEQAVARLEREGANLRNFPVSY